MSNSSVRVSRRDFLSATAALASTAALGPIPGPQTSTSPFLKVSVPGNAPLPLRTAAEEISKVKGIPVFTRSGGALPGEGEVALATVADVRSDPVATGLLPAHLEGHEWEWVRRVGKGLLITGASPRNVCHAALAWLDDPSREEDRLSVFEFSERFTMWDNALNQWYRFSKGFDRQQHIRQLAALGYTGVEINRYADPGGYHVRHRKFPHDSYAWYLSYAPALDAFVESPLTRGIYPREELDANLADLREAAELVRAYGLQPGFVCYEPRCVAEEVFDRHPELRGSRTDHPGRSLQPRYALDIANPRVLDHYAESLTQLMETLPDLRYLVFWTGDSGSGLPFASRLYFGPNGSYLARSKRFEQIAADFTGTLLSAGRKVNPSFEVVMELSWEYTASEHRRLASAMPEGVSLSHNLGGRLMEGGEFGEASEYVVQDRKHEKEPYAAIVVSEHWDPEPIIGIPSPSVLLKKFSELRRLQMKKIIAHGGTLAPPQCPYSLNQRLFAELIRGGISDVESFIRETALLWCGGDSPAAEALTRAWKRADEALAQWPVLNWYHAGPGQTQGRWITRPVVPDISRLDEREREAWERSLFTLPWDVGRLNISFEGGIRMYRDEQFERAVRQYDEAMLPLLTEAVRILEEVSQPDGPAVIRDHGERFRGLLLRETTVRNLFDAQVAINYFVIGKGDAREQRRRLEAAIRSEIANTRQWIRFLKECRSHTFRVTELLETPFLYKTPVADLELKLEVMLKHLEDTPGPHLDELFAANSEAELLFYDGCSELGDTL